MGRSGTLHPMKPWITTALEITGLAAVVVGAWLVGPGTGLIATGGAALVVSYVLSRR